MENTLRLATWNSRGMSAAVPYLRNILESNDIITISEHWLHANRINRLLDISDEFNVFARASRHAPAELFGITRGQGGIAILWRKTISGISPVTKMVHDRFCSIRLETNLGCILYIFALYLPDTSSRDSFDETIDELSGAIDNLEEGAIVILSGDFNGDVGSGLGERSTKCPNKQGMRIINFANKYNFLPINMLQCAKGPVETFTGPVVSSTLDYFMIPSAFVSKVKFCRVLDDEIDNTSDHRPIVLGLSLDNLMPRTFDVKIQSKVKWAKLSIEVIKKKYTDILDHRLQGILPIIDRGINTDDEIDQVFDRIINIINVADNNLPRSKYKPNIKPYWDERLSELKRDKILHYRRWVEQGRPRLHDNLFYIRYKTSKSTFMKYLRQTAREYEQQEIAEVIKSTELDYKFFWKALKKSRNSNMTPVFSIKNSHDVVEHDIDGVLKVWFDHFNELSTPKNKDSYDSEHFNATNAWVENKAGLNDIDQFLEDEFTIDDVRKAIKKLKRAKAPGYDQICAEHIQYGGENLVLLLCSLFNICIQREYVPICFRRGVQIPLYKGKNACSLDPNNYRGITLLSSFNKLFEILLWSRLEHWWHDNKIISECQGACRKKQSCIHSALVLQEAVATSMADNNQCFVAYFDVAKAFDSVWINGLFRQLYDLGIKGRMWRILRKAYIGFKSCVRIHSQVSEWYDLDCGIHQGGFLSSLKYIAFINSLLVDLGNANICISINGISCSPIGYADDMSAACRSKDRVDRVIKIVGDHGNRWRYEYNARKSAVLVYGEDKRTHDRNSAFRSFILNGKKVPEKEHYDHVGVKACIYQNDTTLIDEKISKGRKTLNAATGLGIRRNGLCMAVCNLIFWMVVVPITTYGAEIWIMSLKDIENIESFQRYAGRRLQRFNSSSPSISSFFGLGWIGLTTFICIKKLMFIHTILIMSEDSNIRKNFKERALIFNGNIRIGVANTSRSPIFEMLKISINFGMYEQVMRCLFGLIVIDKQTWKKDVWKRAWNLEDAFWERQLFLERKGQFLISTLSKPRYLTWWYVSDLIPSLMACCEDMAKLVCNASRLKSDDCLFKNSTYGRRMCVQCNLGIEENVNHITMQCPASEMIRIEMFDTMLMLPNDIGRELLAEPGQVLLLLLGKPDVRFDIEQMVQFWAISAYYISKIYRTTVRNRLRLEKDN